MLVRVAVRLFVCSCSFEWFGLSVAPNWFRSLGFYSKLQAIHHLAIIYSLQRFPIFELSSEFVGGSGDRDGLLGFVLANHNRAFADVDLPTVHLNGKAR